MKKTFLLLLLFVLFLNNVLAIDSADVVYSHTFAGGSLTEEVNSGTATAVNSPLNTTGFFDEAYDFNGGNNYIYDTDNTGINYATDSWSICMWLYRQSDSGTYERIFSKSNIASGAKEDWIFQIRSDDKIQFQFNSGGANTGAYSTEDTVSTGTWTYLCGVFNNTGNFFVLYQNNNEQTQSTFGTLSNAPANTASYELQFPRHCEAGGCYSSANVIIDEILIFNKAITSAEVSELYNSGSGLQYPFSTGSSAINLTTTATNNYENTINSFNATINGTVYTTTNGTLYTDIPANSSSPLYNITLNPLNYFEKSYLNVNISSGTYEATNIIQSIITFQAKEKFTGNSINNFTVSDGTINDTTTNGTATLNLLAGNNQLINITNEQGYYNITSYFNVSALENGTINNFTLYNHILTVQAKDFFTNTSLTNITVNYTDLNYSTTDSESNITGSTINFNLIQGLSLNLTVSPSGYASNTTSLTLPTNISSTYTAYLFKENSVYVRIYDEETDSLITSENVTIKFVGDNLALENTTNTGAIIIEPLIAGDYRIEYSGESYDERTYFVTVTAGGTQTIDIYLLNSSKTTNITATVLDEKGDAVTNSYVKMLRYYLSCNCYKTVEIGLTDYTGTTGLRVQYNEEYYKFIVEYNSLNYLETTPAKITSSELTFRINIAGINPSRNLQSFQNIIYSLTYNNETNNFKYTFSDNNNVVTRGCLNVYTTTTSTDSLYNSTCVNSTASTILINILAENGTTYKAIATIDLNNDTLRVDTLFKSFDFGQEVIGNLGIFLTIILIIGFSFISLWNPSISVMMVLLTLIIATATGILKLSLTPLMAIIGVGMIIIIVNKS